ncbi:hypothetical protein [Paraburkholderia aromaticivorans]|uniref:hypothetical protein n=1 Tax=Paraburkholderia aromaticivorans TaxID=2026199 RepID=UPI0014561AA5|nr:hypothetical protein [Paraburkholderia aromaticivorans]
MNSSHPNTSAATAQAHGMAASSNTTSGQRQVHASAAGVVEDCLAWLDRADAQRIADAGKASRACIGQGRQLVSVIS